MKINKKVEDRIKSGTTKFKKVLEAAKNREQLLKEAEAQEQPPATPQNPSNEAE